MDPAFQDALRTDPLFIEKWVPAEAAGSSYQD
jgi:hypothetical protein